VPPPDRDRVGLCLDCRYARAVETERGGKFYLCRRSETDRGFRKYPSLPVLQCSGYEANAEGGDATRDI
jgi:hypothetical protein